MIRVIIERNIAESLESHYEKIAKNNLEKACKAPGFISGESMRGVNNINHRVVLCSWKSASDWQNWHQSPVRKGLMATLRPLLEGEEVITVVE